MIDYTWIEIGSDYGMCIRKYSPNPWDIYNFLERNISLTELRYFKKFNLFNLQKF